MNNFFDSSKDENKDIENEEENLKEAKEKREEIKEFGTDNGVAQDESIQILPIIGQIEGHQVLPAQSKSTKYEHVIPQLIAMERNDNVKGVLIILNTVGGDVEAGLAIAEMINSLSKPTVSIVIGGGHSIGVPLATSSSIILNTVGGDVEAGLAIAEMINSLSKPTVSIVIGGGHSIGVPLATSSSYSFITPSATMIVHPIRMNGFVIGVAQTFNYFQKMQERIDNFIVRTSKIKKDELRQMMLKSDELLNDMGTILIGKQAVECGLIDEEGGIKDALNKLKELIGEKESKKGV